MVSSLRSDPYALETAYLSVITFDSTAKQVVPLTELLSFQMPEIEASGRTALGEALSLLACRIDAEVTKTTAETKGDWKPLVFLMTDGGSSDSWKRKLADLKQRKIGVMVACAAGQNAKTDVLKQITETVVQLNTVDSASIKAFFKWVSASISAGSQKVEEGGREMGGIGELPPPPPEINIII
jgi:uncharacterized protein YegL